MKDFFNSLLTEGDSKSSRRFVTLIIAFMFILTCSSIPFLLLALFIYIEKLQGLNTIALQQIIDLVKTVLEYEFFIILVGLFVTTVKGRLELIQSWIGGMFTKKVSKTEEVEITSESKPEIE